MSKPTRLKLFTPHDAVQIARHVVTFQDRLMALREALASLQIDMENWPQDHPAVVELRKICGRLLTDGISAEKFLVLALHEEEPSL